MLTTLKPKTFPLLNPASTCSPGVSWGQFVQPEFLIYASHAFTTYVIIRRIRRHLPLSTAKTISNSLISSRLDYCNSLINNIAKQDLSKLQRVQNCLARVVLRAPRFSPSLPLLKQLHWLPVNYRIKFKLSTLTYRALAIHQPPYLASLLHFSNVPIQLRSSTSQQLSIPRTKLNLGKRAFSVAAPIIWNELPTTLKSCESLASFRKNLKTYFFKIAFPT